MRGSLLEFKPNPNRAIQSIYEDIAGGCTLNKSELKNGASGYMSEGILIHLDNLKLGHLVKTCQAWTSFTDSATGIKVYKNHEFKAGDVITNTALTTISRNIIDIDTSAISYDLLNIGSGFGASGLFGSVLIEALSSGVSGMDASYKYSPDAIGLSESPVDMARLNSGFALMVRGTVREANIPYPVDDTIKALFPLIRFV
jgi:hypothetical protein